MENPNHRIDEIFRQRLHDAEVPPPPFVWPAVEHELRKRRRRWMVWLFAFGTVSASVWLWQSQLFTNKGYLIGAVQETTAINPGQQPTSTLNTEAIEASTPPAETPDDVRMVLTQTEKLAHATENKPEKGHISSETQVLIRSTSKGLYPQAGQQPVLEPRPVEQAADFEPTANPADASATETMLQGIAVLSEERLPVALSYPVVSEQSVANAPMFSKHFKSTARRKKNQPKLCYDFARHPSAWLLDVYAGPSFAQRTLTSRAEFQPYLSQRLATEHRSIAMNAGIRASLMFNRNFLVRTGLHFDQVTEVFEFIDPTSVTYILKFNAGDPVPDTLGVQYGENYLKTYNRYAMLDVPLMVGVEMRRGRSGFSINAGLMANVQFLKRGVIIDPNTQEPARFGPVPDKPKNIGPGVTLSEPVFRTNVGLSATASIQWYWHFAPKFRVFVEPTFRQILRPVSLKSHPVEHRYGITGIRLGATKIF